MYTGLDIFRKVNMIRISWSNHSLNILQPIYVMENSLAVLRGFY